MWTKDRSLALSYVMVMVFFATSAAALIFIPSIVKWYFSTSGRDMQLAGWMYAALYGADIFGMAALGCLWRLLHNIKRGMVFVADNVKMIRLISWFAVGVAAAFLPVSIFYLTGILISAAAGFIGLVLRVLKNVFAEAVWLKEENDATI